MRRSGLPARLRRVDPAVAIAFGCILLLLLGGSIYSSNFLSPDYLLQQLKVASFLGVIATGMMMVILIGQIDLSVPWVVAAGAMMACAATAYGGFRSFLAIPFGIFCGARNWCGQRPCGCLPAHSVDDHHACDERGRSGIDGRLHRELCASGFGVAGNALSGNRLSDPRDSEWCARLAGCRHSGRFPAYKNNIRPFAVCNRQPGKSRIYVGDRHAPHHTARVRHFRIAQRPWRRIVGRLRLKASQSMGDAYLLPSIAAVVLGGTHVSWRQRVAILELSPASS